jgi:hypothetical protein
MKCITLMAVAITACLFFACHKTDVPLNARTTTLCQITRVQSVYANGNPGRAFNYIYDSTGILDSLNGGPTSIPFPVIAAHIEYNAQQMPVLVNVAGSWFTTWQYQQNKVVTIKNLGQDWFAYTYDTTGRITRRDSPVDTIWYQYSDNSRNFTKRTYRSSQGPASDTIVINYQYDNKINPLSQWPNFPLNPFAYDLVDSQERVFEPIPENNWTYAASSTQGFTFQEVFYTYAYNNDYPATAGLRQVIHSTSGPDQEKLIDNTYTYDCASQRASYTKK